MLESPLIWKGLRRLVAVSFPAIVVCFTGLPVLADPVTIPSGTDSPKSSLPSTAEMESAVALRCPGESYHVIILRDGKAFLQHLDQDSGSELQPLEISDPLNPTKSTIDCDERSFELRSSPPFSNRLVEHRFTIEKGAPRFAAKKDYDPTEHLLEQAENLALTGNRDALRTVDFSGIEFAYQYVNAERIHRLLNRALQQCDRRPCRPLIENTFFLITRLSMSVSGTERDAARPEEWILALDDLAVPVADSAPILLRYAQILKHNNQRDQAMVLVAELIRRDQDTPDLHLVYGDLLWENGKKDEARVQYRAFADLIAREGKTPPARIARLLAD